MTRRALISVYDKTGIVEFGASLAELGWEIVSSGGTAKALADAGVDVVPTESLTGFGDMLGHRVVTLHPSIHGGILADRDDPAHRSDLAEHGITPIDLVVGNLYPFSSDPGIELIDIGGPAMVRGAAKNHAHVGVVVEPARYGAVLDELRSNGWLSDDTRRALARAAFAHTAAYDAAIVEWLDASDASGVASNGESAAADDIQMQLPDEITIVAHKAASLRYGENPHQVGARYVVGHGGWWDTAEQLGGKEMSYLNVYDADAAWRLVWTLGELSTGDVPAAVVIKHANPCGAAVGASLLDAYQRAHEGDPVSAFGGIVAFNRTVTVDVAKALAPVFTEVVVAPSFDDDALKVLKAKKNVRVLRGARPIDEPLDVRTISGGLLVQTTDPGGFDRERCRVVTEREPTEAEWADLEISWRLAARVMSNCIVLVKDGQAVGIGAGQQNRRDAGQIAADKAAGRAAGGACASDAFFPFRDGLDAAAAAGATAVIQPGGSVRDGEVIEAANEQGMAMVFTGERHFRH